MDEVLYVYGGAVKGQTWRNDLWALDLWTGQWRRLAADCNPSNGHCPPPARGAAIQGAGTPGVVTVVLGRPTVQWSGTAHEWRYLLDEGLWVTEDEAREMEVLQ